MADEEGFLIIDEVPAVGMMRSTHNFAAAGTGQYTYFFEAPTVPELLKNHIQQVKEMMARDKNHPAFLRGACSMSRKPPASMQRITSRKSLRPPVHWTAEPSADRCIREEQCA